MTRGSLQRTRLNTALAYAEAEYKLERYDSKVSEAVAAIEGNSDDEKNAKPRRRRRRSWRMGVAYKIAEKEMEEFECPVVYSLSLYVNESKMHLST